MTKQLSNAKSAKSSSALESYANGSGIRCSYRTKKFIAVSTKAQS
jgi:hypothetical protein